MRIVYDVVIFIYHLSIRIAALFGNEKARLWTDGRKKWEEKIQNALLKAGKKRIWFHCASLGEFEQGRPLIEKLKSKDDSLFIVLSFFSPSGFELRKNYSVADLVCYLPIDTKRNAKKFISIVEPAYVIFIKYEFWYHYFKEIKKKNIPLYIVSAVFRPSQVFFKWYGSFYRNILKKVDHFFLQDYDSKKILTDFGFQNTTVTGDTRFDRVHAITLESKKIDIIEKFKQDKKLFIAGSTWPEDEVIFFPALNSLIKNNFKIVIAPHEVNEKRIQEIIKNISNYFNFSEIVRYSSVKEMEKASVLIIDNLGLLSSAYRYGTIAWIGGGFGKGIHNILEAATYGMPVIFGTEYKKFREAIALIERGGAFTVRNKDEAKEILNELAVNDQKLKQSSQASSSYVLSKLGATDKIKSMLPELNPVLK